MLVEAFPSAEVVAVGRKAEGLLKRMDVRATHVPHPAYGGAFSRELKKLANG
jgi:hypothetical protein